MGTSRIATSAIAALVIAHCAGMLDLVALPVWVGALVERYGFAPRGGAPCPRPMGVRC